MSLEQVIADVRRDGEARAQEAVQQARREAARVLEAAKAEARAHEHARLSAADKEAAAILAQAQSRAESESRKAVLGVEAQLRAQMRATVLQGLESLPAKTREGHLKKLLAQAQAVIPKGTVWGSAKDEAFLQGQKGYRHAGSLAIAGGIVVEAEDGKTRLDLTYETILEDAWRDVLKAEAGLFQ